MADLINRNAAAAFSLGLVEVALYDLGGDSLAIQPRVVARTHLIERNVVLLAGENGAVLAEQPPEAGPVIAEPSAAANPVDADKQEAHRKWWLPVVEAALDDPEQDPPTLRWPNNVRVQLPWPRTWITAYRSMAGGKDKLGVVLVGSGDAVTEFWRAAEPLREQIVEALPVGTVVTDDGTKINVSQTVSSGGLSDDERRDWLVQTINGFVNALRPAMKRLV